METVGLVKETIVSVTPPVCPSAFRKRVLVTGLGPREEQTRLYLTVLHYT